MRKFAAILLLSASAFALPLCHKPKPKPPKPPKPPVKTPGPHVTPVSSSTSTANANATAAAGASSNSNQAQSLTETYQAPRIPVSTAYAPTMVPTVPCFKGASAGVQTMAAGVSVGGGKIDENCAALETARSFAEAGKLLAYCKVMVTTKAAKVAGVTLEDCIAEPVVSVNAPVPQVSEPVPPVAPTVVVRDLPIMPTVIFGPPIVTTVYADKPIVSRKKVTRRKVTHKAGACEEHSKLSCRGL